MPPTRGASDERCPRRRGQNWQLHGQDLSKWLKDRSVELTGEGVDSAVMQHSVDRSRRYGSVNGFLEIKHQKNFGLDVK